jgi:hypothetical protein
VAAARICSRGTSVEQVWRDERVHLLHADAARQRHVNVVIDCIETALQRKGARVTVCDSLLL